jgi:hypothetical protein
MRDRLRNGSIHLGICGAAAQAVPAGQIMCVELGGGDWAGCLERVDV